MRLYNKSRKIEPLTRREEILITIVVIIVVTLIGLTFIYIFGDNDSDQANLDQASRSQSK